jgi:hypothetical protein
MNSTGGYIGGFGMLLAGSAGVIIDGMTGLALGGVLIGFLGAAKSIFLRCPLPDASDIVRYAVHYRTAFFFAPLLLAEKGAVFLARHRVPFGYPVGLVATGHTAGPIQYPI